MAKDKMNIVAYETSKYSGKGVGKASVKINPASYTHNHTVNYDAELPDGAPGTPLEYLGTPPQTVSFDIYFDATGTIPTNNIPVKVQLDQFKKVCFKHIGKIHEPYFLIVSWGSLVFKCKLTTLNISYTLFKSDGTPLRAKASVTFQEALDADYITKLASNKSPDLTQLLVVKDGDSLPLMCYTIYGNSNYYAEVAKFNNIANFRKLSLGTKIYFPPIK